MKSLGLIAPVAYYWLVASVLVFVGGWPMVITSLAAGAFMACILFFRPRDEELTKKLEAYETRITRLENATKLGR